MVNYNVIRLEGGYAQHDDADGEAALCLHAVASDLLVLDDAAAFGQVPGRAVVDALGIDGVRRGLNVDAVRPER